jgi:hypothetical protein
MAEHVRRDCHRTLAEVRWSVSGTTTVEVYDEYKVVHLSQEACDNIQRYRDVSAAEFEAKFGREMGPDDPLVWDADADLCEPISEERLRLDTIAAMRSANIREELVFAFEMTGRIVSAENWTLCSSEDLDEWNAAVELFRLCGPLSGELFTAAGGHD